MITILYFLSILIIGYACSKPFATSDIERVAISPALTFLIMGLTIFIFNMVGISINHLSIRIFYLLAFSTAVYFCHKDLISLLKNIFGFYHKQNKLTKIIIAIIVIGLLSILIRGQIRPQWGEDAKRVWVGKPLEWIQFQKLQLSQTSLKDLAIWADYPLLHKVTIMFHILVLPLKYKYSSNVTDYFYIISLFFAYLYIFKSLKFDSIKSLIAAFFALFLQRQMLAFNGASLAEFNIAYLYPISFFTLKKALEIKDIKRLVLAGIFLGMISITKNEGIYRVFFLLFTFAIFYFKEFKRNLNSFLILLIPILLLFIFNKLNMHTDSSKNIWIDNSTINLQTLGNRVIYVFKAMYYSIAPKGIFKSSWLLLTLLSLTVFIKSIKENGSNKILFLHVALLYFLNWSFDHLPTLLIQPGNFAYRDVPAFSGIDVIGRLHIQSATLFVIIGIWGAIRYEWINLSIFYKKSISLE